MRATTVDVPADGSITLDWEYDTVCVLLEETLELVTMSHVQRDGTFDVAARYAGETVRLVGIN